MNIKKRLKFCYLLFIFANIQSFAQIDTAWTKTYQISEPFSVEDFKLTKDGGTITLLSNSEKDWSGYNKDIQIIKTDSLGLVLWNKIFDSGYRDIGKSILEVDGGFVVFGTEDREHNGGAYARLQKIDKNGNELWNKNYVGAGHIVMSNGDNGFLLVGKNNGDSNKVWLAKADSLGEVEWFKTYFSPLDSLKISMLELNMFNEVYGYQIMITNNFYEGTHILQVSSAGDLLFDKFFDSVLGFAIAGVTEDCNPDSGFIVTGTDFNNFEGWESLLIKNLIYNRFMWTKTYPFPKEHEGERWNPRPKSIVRSFDGGYLISGELITHGELTYPFVAKIDPEYGSAVYSTPFGKDDKFGSGTNILLSKSGNAFLCGKINSKLFLAKLSAKPNVIITADSNLDDNDWDGYSVAHLDGSTSNTTNGYKIKNYQWSFNGEVVGVNSALDIELPTGDNVIELEVTDEMGISNIAKHVVKICSYKYETNGPISSAISTINDSIFFASSTDDQIYCFDNSNNLKWTLATGGDIQSTTTIGPNGNIYVGSADTRLYCFDPKGNFKWDTPMGGTISASPAITQERTVYVGTENNRLYSVNGNDGSINWNYLSGGPILSSVSLSKSGDIYFGSNDKKFYSLNPLGDLNWSFNTNGAIQSSSAIDTLGKIYFGSDDKKLYALNPNGSLAWTFDTGGAIKSSPVIDSEGNIYFGSSDGYLYCVDEKGKENWKFNTESPVNGNPSLTRVGNVIFGCDDGNIYSLSKSGILNWSYKTDNSVVAAPLITKEGRAYVGSSDNSIYGFIDLSPLSFSYTHQWPTFQKDNKRTGSQIDIQTGVKNVISLNIPNSFELFQNYPNPFNPSTQIQFHISETSNIKLDIYNVNGEKINTLVSEKKDAGVYSIDWNGLNNKGDQVGSGIYILQMKAKGISKTFSKSIKMIKLK